MGWAGSDSGAGEGTTFSGLEDAYLDWDASKRGLFHIRGGQFKVPFGRQEFTSSEKQQFVDRSILSFEFTKSRDVGVMLWGATAQSRVAWALGAFNGNQRNRPANDNGKMQWNARLTFQPWGDVGYSEADFESKDHPLLAVEGEFENNDRHGVTNANDFARPHLRPERRVQVQGPVALRASTSGATARRRRERPSAPTATTPRPGTSCCGRRLEVAARYAAWDPTDAVADNDLTELAGAAQLLHPRTPPEGHAAISAAFATRAATRPPTSCASRCSSSSEPSVKRAAAVLAVLVLAALVAERGQGGGPLLPVPFPNGIAQGAEVGPSAKVGAAVWKGLEAAPRVRVIVALREPTTPVQALAERMAEVEALQGNVLERLAAADFRLTHRWDTISAIAGDATPQALAVLARDPDVLRIDVDEPMFAATGESVSLMRADEVLNQGVTGRGIVVAILDTGVERSHPDLGLQHRGRALLLRRLLPGRSERGGRARAPPPTTTATAPTSPASSPPTAGWRRAASPPTPTSWPSRCSTARGSGPPPRSSPASTTC